MVGSLQIPQCNCACPPLPYVVPRTFDLVLTGCCCGAAFVTGCIAASLIWRWRVLSAKAILSLLRQTWRPLSPMQRQLQAMAQQKRLEHWLVITDLTNLFPAFSTVVAVGLAVYVEVFDDDTAYFALYIAIVSTFLVLAPFVVLRRSVHLVDLALSFIFVVIAIPPGLAITSTGYYFTSQIARLTHAVAAQASNPCYFLPLTVLHLAWQLWTICTSPGLRDALVQNVALSLHSSICNVVACCGGAAVQWITAKALWQADHKRAIVRAFLSAMSDSFVELQADFTLAEDCVSLAGLRQGAAQDSARRGMSFLDFLLADDRERFKTFVGANTSTVNVAPQISVSLCNIAGEKIPVKMYHMSVEESVEGEARYYVGIVLERLEELCDTTAQQEAPDSATALREEIQQGQPEGDRAPSVHSAGPFQAEGVAPWGASGDRPTMKIRTWFNFEVLEESDSCQEHFGFKDHTLAEFLSRCSRPNENLRYLELSHCLSVNGHGNPYKTWENVKVSAPADGAEYLADIHVEITQLPDRPPEDDLEVDIDKIRFNPDIRFVEMELKFTPVEEQEEEEEEVHRGDVLLTEVNLQALAGTSPEMMSL